MKNTNAEEVLVQLLTGLRYVKHNASCREDSPASFPSIERRRTPEEAVLPSAVSRQHMIVELTKLGAAPVVWAKHGKLHEGRLQQSVGLWPETMSQC